MSVARNAYGRQVASFEADLEVTGLEDAFHAIFQEAAAIVERDLPGTVVYELFGNKETSRFVARGDYVDGAAFQKHAERLMETGVLARMAELADFDLNISLGDVDDDVRDMLDGGPQAGPGAAAA